MKAIAILLCGLTIRCIVACLAVSKTNLNWKEKLFVSISWLPKATVQVRHFWFGKKQFKNQNYSFSGSFSTRFIGYGPIGSDRVRNLSARSGYYFNRQHYFHSDHSTHGGDSHPVAGSHNADKVQEEGRCWGCNWDGRNCVSKLLNFLYFLFDLK